MLAAVLLIAGMALFVPLPGLRSPSGRRPCRAIVSWRRFTGTAQRGSRASLFAAASVVTASGLVVFIGTLTERAPPCFVDAPADIDLDRSKQRRSRLRPPRSRRPRLYVRVLNYG